MSTTVPEVKTTNFSGSASSSLALSTTLVSTDLIIVLLSKQYDGTVTISINGSAAPAYGNWDNGSGKTRLYAYSKTGITGTHSVSYTSDSLATFNRLTVLVIRGLSNPVISDDEISVWDGATTAANTDEGPASISIGADQVGVFAGVATAGTLTFPSNPTPSGWTSARTETAGYGRSNVAYYIFTGSGTAQASIKSTSTTELGAVMLIAGTSVVSLTSTFVGWGNPIF